MNNALSHRGPDGEGFWESSPDDRGVGAMLAHRRLSILDLTDAAAQPMIDPITGHVITFNGEIYNYTSLRNRLAGAGQSFESTGDTAVMLRALGLHGTQAMSWLRGMFAFALWDPKARTLLLARDPLGIKPLYFACNPDPSGAWALIFASEIRGLLASELLGNPRLNPDAPQSVAWNGFIVAPDTAVKGINTIWPGQFCVFDSLGREKSSDFFWTIPRPDFKAGGGASGLEHALEESVRLHLASDVPLGVFLSGGIDSAAVANLAQKATNGSVHTFTLAFEEPAFNEGVVARRIADAIGTQHREVVLTEQHFIAELDSALDSLDQPSFDGLNSYYMSKAVRDAGIKVALVGTGGDELFGGYTSFRDLPPLTCWLKRANFVPQHWRDKLAHATANMLSPAQGAVKPQTRWAKLPYMVRRGDDLLSLYQLAYALFLPDFQRQLLQKQIMAMADGLPASMRARLHDELSSRSSLSAISVLEQRLFLGERLLRDTDATSMAASIEIRLPLVDSAMVESANRLPDEERYYPVRRKAMLRRIGLRGLDPALFERPKSGFELPYDRWLRKGVGRLMDDVMRDPVLVKPTGLEPDTVRRLWQAFVDGAPGLYWTRIWAVYVFIRWCHRHKVYL